MKIHGDLVAIFDNQSEILQENPKTSISKWSSQSNFHAAHCKSLKAQYYVSAVGLNVCISKSFQATWRLPPLAWTIQAVAGQTGRQDLGFLLGHFVAFVSRTLMASLTLWHIG